MNENNELTIQTILSLDSITGVMALAFIGIILYTVIELAGKIEEIGDSE